MATAHRAPPGRTGIWAVVPIKGFDAVKKRLAGLLGADERRALMLAMANDVLAALAQSRLLGGVLIVSRAAEADALADAFGAGRFAESAATNLPGALEEAAAHLAATRGASGIFVIPADVPLIGAAEIDALLAAHQRVTLLPDRDQVGTNGLICSPPDAIELVFDGRSFEPHRRAAHAAGIKPSIVSDSRFALDIDTPDDLVQLLQAAVTTRTGAYLKQAGIDSRLAALKPEQRR